MVAPSSFKVDGCYYYKIHFQISSNCLFFNINNDEDNEIFPLKLPQQLKLAQLSLSLAVESLV